MFDPKTHKFGMAYKYLGDIEPVYICMYDDLKNVAWAQDGDGWSAYKNNLQCKLKIWPEHDLIPRSAVDGLIEALKWARHRLDYESIARETFSSMVDHTPIDKAISDFQFKHGVK